MYILVNMYSTTNNGAARPRYGFEKLDAIFLEISDQVSIELKRLPNEINDGILCSRNSD